MWYWKTINAKLELIKPDFRNERSYQDSKRVKYIPKQSASEISRRKGADKIVPKGCPRVNILIRKHLLE